MSQLDDLLERSRAPGRFVERRTFTLSREKAIEKQREFALRHPRQYVLELIQAAVFAGATYIAIDTRPHSLLVAWVGGPALTARDLEGLFDYLFADRGDARWRHLVQLAIGVNAILQRRPRTLRIESGDGAAAVRMDLDAKGHGTVGVPTDPIGGTYLYVEYGGGWFSRFAGGSWTEEQGLVEERCLYTPVPILLNGSAPFGYRGSRHIEIFGARQQEHFDEGGRRGVVAVHTSPRAPTGFRMVVGGVWVSTLQLEPLADIPLVGVVCDDHLRKTADQSDIVQDHRYVEMLHAVQPVATRLMGQLEGTRYRPPPLPPIPKVDAARPNDRGPEGPEPEPLPDPIPMLGTRGATTIDALQHIGDVPLFYVEPQHEMDLIGRTAEPDRFPWRVLVITEGQAMTLSAEVPEAALHRLTSKADVDFVRRVVDRRVRVRELTIPGPGYRLVLRLHLEGPLPDWGHGRPGMPFCVTDDRGTVEFGVVDGDRIRLSGSRGDEGPPREIRTTFRLPRVSLRLEVDREDRALEERHLALALSRAWELAVPERGDPHRELLCALVGALAVPQYIRSEAGISVGASLPVGWPESLRHVPVIATDEGELTLEGVLALLGGTEVRGVSDLDALLALDPVEHRFGYGHLTHPVLEGRPLFGVGRIGPRWVWLEDRSMWGLDVITQMIWVGATFRPRERDARWLTDAHPYPELVSAVRADVQPTDWESGWSALLENLQRIEAEALWGRYVTGPVTVGRCEGLGRLALIHLAELLNKDDQPLLVPSDGGGRRSLAELRSHAATRVVARHGVRLAEPWTFALTRDELAVVEHDGSAPRLRYDDAPEVWRSLSEAEQGWLVRHEVRQGGLRGWLGLRCPHDGTAGILLRTTGQLVALSEVDRNVPAHGLLWPEDGGSVISTDQRRLVQLAGLRLYQGLIAILRDRPDPVSTEAARRYATTFALLAWQRSGRLQGTAAELARLVTVLGTDGHPWGTLVEWLEAAPDSRPELPSELVPPEEPGAALEVAEGLQERSLHGRLYDALGAPPVALSVMPIDGGRSEPPVVLDLARSHRGRAILLLNQAHPLTRAGIGQAGRHREVLLLEMARQICAWGEPLGLDLDLCRTQQVLLAQRIAE